MPMAFRSPLITPITAVPWLVSPLPCRRRPRPASAQILVVEPPAHSQSMILTRPPPPPGRSRRTVASTPPGAARGSPGWLDEVRARGRRVAGVGLHVVQLRDPRHGRLGRGAGRLDVRGLDESVRPQRIGHLLEPVLVDRDAVEAPEIGKGLGRSRPIAGDGSLGSGELPDLGMQTILAQPEERVQRRAVRDEQQLERRRVDAGCRRPRRSPGLAVRPRASRSRRARRWQPHPARQGNTAVRHDYAPLGGSPRGLTYAPSTPGQPSNRSTTPCAEPGSTRPTRKPSSSDRLEPYSGSSVRPSSPAQAWTDRSATLDSPGSAGTASLTMTSTAVASDSVNERPLPRGGRGRPRPQSFRLLRAEKQPEVSDDCEWDFGPSRAGRRVSTLRSAGWCVWLVGGDRASGRVREHGRVAGAAGVDVLVVQAACGVGGRAGSGWRARCVRRPRRRRGGAPRARAWRCSRGTGNGPSACAARASARRTRSARHASAPDPARWA